MFNWIKRKIVNIAIGYIRTEIEKVEEKEPDIRVFREALYSKNIDQFMKWGLERLDEGSTDMTPVQLVKKRLAPLRDDIETVIDQVIDGLNPHQGG